MFHKPKITIRQGAAHNEVTVDSQTFELGTLSRGQQKLVRGVVVGALTKQGYFQ